MCFKICHSHHFRGSNDDFGCTGQGRTQSDEYHTPGSVVGEIQQEYRIDMLEIGLCHSVVLTRPEGDSEETKMWAFGGNFSGQLGNGANDWESHAVASAVVFFAQNKIRVQSISCGGHFNGALSASGDLYMW